MKTMMTFDWAGTVYGLEAFLSTHKELTSLLAVILACVVAQVFMILCRKAAKAMLSILVIVVVSVLMITDGWRAATLDAVTAVLDLIPPLR